MWPFSGKSEDEYYRQPQQEESSFLGNIGSMLWTGVKAAFYALLAVVTLGTIFTMSDGAKDFADKYAFGMGSKIKGWMDSGVDTVKEFISPSPKTDTPNSINVSTTKFEKVGDSQLPVPNNELNNSEINKNPAYFQGTTDVNGTRKSLNAAMVSKEDSEKGYAALNETRRQSMTYLTRAAEWNYAVNSTAGERASDAPKPPILPLDKLLPNVSDNSILDAAGMEISPTAWKEKTKLQKIQLLEATIGISSDPIIRPKDLPAPSHINIPALRDATDVNNITSLRDGNITAPLSKLGSLSNKFESLHDWEIRSTNAKNDAKKANEAISSLVQEGRFSEATLVANSIIERLEMYGSKLADNKKAEGAEFKSSIASLKKTREYTIKLERRKELDPYLDQTYSAAIKIAADAPQLLANYNGEVQNYKGTVISRQAIENAARERDENKGENKDGHGLPNNANVQGKDASQLQIR